MRTILIPGLLASASATAPVKRAEHVFKYNDPKASKCSTTPDCEEGSIWWVRELIALGLPAPVVNRAPVIRDPNAQGLDLINPVFEASAR